MMHQSPNWTRLFHLGCLSRNYTIDTARAEDAALALGTLQLLQGRKPDHVPAIATVIGRSPRSPKLPYSKSLMVHTKEV